MQGLRSALQPLRGKMSLYLLQTVRIVAQLLVADVD